ncbi:hypothetical protein JCM10212_003476 [Sporobolomyces blumeae]
MLASSTRLLVLLATTASSGAAASVLARRANADLSHPTQVDDLERRHKIIVAHGIVGFLALQVFAPMAVVIASVGRSWGPIWYKLHSRIHAWIVFPSTVLCVSLAAASTTYEKTVVMDKHKILGFVLLGGIVLQMLVGFWAHYAQKQKERYRESDELVPPKRRISNWIHIALGLALLTFGGLQVTWGVGEYTGLVGQVPTWIQIVHFAVAGVPVALVTPFVLVRGFLRMRRGQTFAQAFFDRPITPRNYVPPRKLFLGSSSYIEEAYATAHNGGDGKGEEGESLVGHAYSKGRGVDGRLRVEGDEADWPGAKTREEYETSVELARRRQNASTSLETGSTASYDHVPYDAAVEESTSLVSRAAPMATQQVDSAPSTIRPSYPPTSPPATFAPFIAPDAPAFPSSSLSPVPLPVFSRALHTPPPPAMSPRLAWMPFAGGVPVHHRPRADTVGSHDLSSHGTTNSSSTMPVPRIQSVEAEGEGEHKVVVVPTPPPAYDVSSRDGDHQVSVADSLISKPVAVRDGDSDPAASTTSPGVTRHTSIVGEIVGLPRQSAGTLLEASTEEPGRDGGRERAEADDSELYELHNDSESTRLMDELERELSISASSTRTGRSRRTTGTVDGFVGNEGEADPEGSSGVESEVDERTKLEREQSGKWFGGAGTK